MTKQENEKRILITDDFHPVLFEKLEAAGITYNYWPDSSKQQAAEELKKGYEGLMVRSKLNIDRQLLLECPDLKVVFRGGAGMDNIDVEACEKREIKLYNSGNANSDAVAEQAIGMMLGVATNINKAAAEVKNNIWQREPNRGFELKNKTLGIIGFGNTGSALAKKMQGFEMQILAYDKYKTGFGNKYVKETTWEEIQEKADIVSLHIPLTEETRFLINENLLSKFKNKILLLNLSRGEIVKTSAILEALENNKLLGFCADVLEQENFNTMTVDYKSTVNKILNYSNVIITPHIGGWTFESYEAIALKMAEAVIEYDHFRESNFINKQHFKEKDHETIITKKTL